LGVHNAVQSVVGLLTVKVMSSGPDHGDWGWGAVQGWECCPKKKLEFEGKENKSNTKPNRSPWVNSLPTGGERGVKVLNISLRGCTGEVGGGMRKIFL